MRAAPAGHPERLPRWLVLSIFALAFAARAGLVLRHPGNFDTALYARFAQLARSGANLYGASDQYKWSPVWAHMLWWIQWMADRVGLPLHKAVGLLLLLVDSATAWLVYRIARQLGRPTWSATGSAMLFFANPVSILASGFNVQWDTIAIFFLLVAVSVGIPPKGVKLSMVAALAASLSIKHITWFHPVLFFRDRRRGYRLRFQVLLPYALFLLMLLPYAHAWDGIRKNVFVYRGGFEHYGVCILIERGWLPGWGATLLLLAAVAVTLVKFRKLEPAQASLRLFLVLLIFLPGIQQYYFVWPIALGALFPGAGYAVYTVVAATFLMHSPDGLQLDWRGLPDWQGVWWAAVLWLLLEIRRDLRNPEAPRPAEVDRRAGIPENPTGAPIGGSRG